MKHLLLLSVTLLFFLSACKKDNPPGSPEIKHGKNVFTTTVDGVEREYLVHVPQSYDGSANVPMVFMLHGTGGEGQDMYDNSGWPAVGETENILTVFPSSLRHCIFDEGEQKTTAKWNSQPTDNWYFCPNVTPPDDIKFLQTVIAEMKDKYAVDEKRIYLVGFSNGGQMAAKCSVWMSDQLAAVVESASSFSIDTTFSPKRKLPITFQIGNDDHGPGNDGPELPMSNFADAMMNPVFKLHDIAQTHIKSFGLDPNFTMSGDTNTVVIATYRPLNGDTTNNFNMALIKDLKHAYPNGNNHWLEAAKNHWAWMKKYTLP